MRISTWLVVAGLLATAACSKDDKRGEAKRDDDPVASGALGDEIMVDPELAGQKGGAGAAAIELPPEQRTPEAIAAAKAEALKLAGGTIESAPAPETGDADHLVDSAVTAAQVAAAAKAGKADCAGKVEYSARWANALPEALGVYPQGAVSEAAGTDRDGCKLRVVGFVTPVAVSDVVDFYYTRLRAAGYQARHMIEKDVHVLGGSKGVASYLVYARQREDGLSEVDLVASGG